jgi:hypothetical protein
MNGMVGSSGLSWAPDECTLPTVERPLRAAEFDTLFASDVTGAIRTSGSTVVFALTPDPAVAARVAELVARETSCCSFFTFTLTATDGRLSLAVTVPASHQPVLDALVERAQTHVGGKGTVTGDRAESRVQP